MIASTVIRELDMQYATQLVAEALDLVVALQSAMNQQRQGLALTPAQLADLDRYTRADGVTEVHGTVLVDVHLCDEDISSDSTAQNGLGEKI